MSAGQPIAYFSMEIALDAAIPTYAGGLGVLAGDTLRAAADLGVAMVGVTLLHRKGYVRQSLDAAGWQTERPQEWDVGRSVTELPERSTVSLEGRTVYLRAWRYDVRGVGGGIVPVFLLDTDLPENSAWDRTLTDHLYGRDQRYRICQEVVLGIGGVRMVRALGYRISRYHMNEGHAALLGLELLEEEARSAGRSTITWADVEAVRSRCVFTTHTPVPAGHDKFPMELMRQVVGPRDFDFEWRKIVYVDGLFNLTYVALNLSRYVNGVAKRHAEVSRLMFARHAIDAITNGVHAATWASPPFQALFDRHIPDWRSDNLSLRYAAGIPQDEVWRAHMTAKEALLAHVNARHPVAMEPGVFTIGFARRATAYKRADLLFQDVDRLKSIAASVAAFQLVFAGNAHPNDAEGKQIIKRLFTARERLKGYVNLAYLEHYDMGLAKLMTSGVDLWLNTPQPPMEASGTSGMKAALNGVPSLSVLDGWWIEGHIEGITGWSIGSGVGHDLNEPERQAADASALYDTLEGTILPMFCGDRHRFLEVMAHCIALNGSFFNTHRMLQQYVLRAYLA